MQTTLKIPLHLAKRIEKVAERENVPFSRALIFLLKEVITPRQPTRAQAVEEARP